MGSKKGSSLKRLKILAIDDEETILKLFTSILGEEGHAVETSSSGSEALKRFEQEDFDLIFLDLKLPDIDGNDVLTRIRKKDEWIPVVIVTANPTLESSIDAIRAGGVYEYIIKPFGGNELKMTIQRVMEKSELTIQNKRLLRKLESANQALTERVDELERIARKADKYEKTINDLELKINSLKK